MEQENKRITPLDLMNSGGAWLGRARSWIQYNCMNGETVTWGSDDVLEKTFTVRDIEELSARVAASAINEYKQKNK